MPSTVEISGGIDVCGKPLKTRLKAVFSFFNCLQKLIKTLKLGEKYAGASRPSFLFNKRNNNKALSIYFLDFIRSCFMCNTPIIYSFRRYPWTDKTGHDLIHHLNCNLLFLSYRFIRRYLEFVRHQSNTNRTNFTQC